MFYRLLISTVCFLLMFSSPFELMVNAQVPQATSSAGPGRKMYIAKLGEWKQMLKDLQKLRSDFDLAKPSEIPAIRKSWAETTAEATCTSGSLSAAQMCRLKCFTASKIAWSFITTAICVTAKPKLSRPRFTNTNPNFTTSRNGLKASLRRI